VEYQIVFEIPSTPSKLPVYTLNRGRRDFTQRDRGMLQLIASHVSQAYRRIVGGIRFRRLSQVVENMAEKRDLGIILIRSEGRMERVNGQATVWLAEYFGQSMLTRLELPSPLNDWVAACEAACDPRPIPYRIEKENRTLTIELVQEPDSGDKILLMKEEDGAYSRELDQYDLTARVREVLTWLARGKTNMEIGII
jgi:hypothetical protein